MPLTQSSLSGRIQSEIIAAEGPPTDASKLTKFADALAKAIVDEIQANALVNTTGADPQGGVVTSTGTVT